MYTDGSPRFYRRSTLNRLTINSANDMRHSSDNMHLSTPDSLLDDSPTQRR